MRDAAFSRERVTVVFSFNLRTFARKSSNIDNFIKLLLLITNELLV